LQSCQELLSKYGEGFWADKIEAVLNRKPQDDNSMAYEVLSWFGGMGSINDVVISKANKHRIASDEEDAVNETLKSTLGEIYGLLKAEIPEGFREAVVEECLKNKQDMIQCSKQALACFGTLIFMVPFVIFGSLMCIHPITGSHLDSKYCTIWEWSLYAVPVILIVGIVSGLMWYAKARPH